MTKLIAFPLIALTLTFGACGTAEEGEVEIPVEEIADVADAKADGARTARFETFTGQDGQSYFHLLAANGQRVLGSQGYASAQGALDGINSVRAAGAAAESYALLQARDGQWYFNLLAVNGQIVATSELYATRSNAERAVTTIAGLVPVAAQTQAAIGSRFQIFRGLDGQHYFHLRARNGEIVLQSEGYSRKASAAAGIASVFANGVDHARYQVKDAASGQAYFVLTATNGQVIGASETYATRAAAEAGVFLVLDLLSAASAAQN